MRISSNSQSMSVCEVHSTTQSTMFGHWNFASATGRSVKVLHANNIAIVAKMSVHCTMVSNVDRMKAPRQVMGNKSVKTDSIVWNSEVKWSIGG